MEKLLEVKELKTYYYTRSRTVPAADDVSFDVYRGEVVGLVGESGCGKSTVARSIVGLINKGYTRIESGEVLFNGKDLTKATKKELCEIRGNKISMIFQDPFVSLSPVYTIGDQIYEVMKAHEPRLRRKEARARILELMHKVGIPSPELRINDYPYQMSGGMQQRIMIAIALACNPDVLLADEPTTALDVTVQAQVLELLRELKNEFQMSIILILPPCATGFWSCTAVWWWKREPAWISLRIPGIPIPRACWPPSPVSLRTRRNSIPSGATCLSSVCR